MISWHLFLSKWIGKHWLMKRASARLRTYEIPDEAYYEQVAHEIGLGQIRPGLMAKAWTQAGGDQARADVIYMKLRVQSMRDEAAGVFRRAGQESEAAEPVYHEARRALLNCPRCRQSLRVAGGKYLEINCPKCANLFFAQT